MFQGAHPRLLQKLHPTTLSCNTTGNPAPEVSHPNNLVFLQLAVGVAQTQAPLIVLVGTGLVLLILPLWSCSSHSHNWVTTGGKGEVMRCSHIQKEKSWGRTWFQRK